MYNLEACAIEMHLVGLYHQKKSKKDAAYDWLVRIINNEVDHENTRGDVYEEL